MAMTSVLSRDLADLERSSHSAVGRDIVAVAKKLSDICSHASRRMEKYHSLYAHASKEMKNQVEARANDQKVFEDSLANVRANAEAELQKVKDELVREKEIRAELEKARDKTAEREEVRSRAISEFCQSQEYQTDMALHVLEFEAKGFVDCRSQVKAIDSTFSIERLEGPPGTELSEGEDSEATEVNEANLAVTSPGIESSVPGIVVPSTEEVLEKETQGQVP
ncbi:uncharacterized protein LOC143885980 [Tasmannia lanceolata]|uniref:uncharacterized protein LOC143885980 n=1 Tax=Tasmannia lanceolata TaxID=3420 RepID=UPI004062B26E